jgi:CRP-like cAMP-binding protein
LLTCSRTARLEVVLAAQSLLVAEAISATLDEPRSLRHVIINAAAANVIKVQRVLRVLGHTGRDGVMLTHKTSRLANVVGYPTSARSSIRSAATPARLINFGPTIKTFLPNARIFDEGERTDHVYKLTRGTVRTYKMLSNGRRTIDAFRLPGDLFGVDPTDAREFTAEAIDNVAVMIVQRNLFVENDVTGHDDFRDIWTATARELHRVQQHALLLAKTGQQRLACFLLEMSQRLRQTDVLELPMPRQDIADYLGLTIETVCRMVAQLESRGMIEAKSRQIALRDLGALQRLNEGA